MTPPLSGKRDDPAKDRPAQNRPAQDRPAQDEARDQASITHSLAITAREAGLRLDKALALLAADLPGLSRSRIAQAIAQGRLRDQTGATVSEPNRKVKPGEIFAITLEPPAPGRPLAQAMPLTVAYEDAHLIVIDKPPGMVVHPAPGAETGTLVNALLAHCGASLAGIGGERRPGIVHRIDKDTSGLIVAAKTEAAHAGLAALFARHDILREYLALAWGAPGRADPRLAGMPGVSFEPGNVIRIATGIARHRTDRKRMAVTATGGRSAVTRLEVLQSFGPRAKPVASLLRCTLETGRTHQIRVHAAHIGHALIGDQTYGRARTPPRGAIDAATAAALAGFPRQALHAARLGFRHPVTAEMLDLHSELCTDFKGLLAILQRNSGSHPL